MGTVTTPASSAHAGPHMFVAKGRRNWCELLDSPLTSRNAQVSILNCEAEGILYTVVLARAEEVGSISTTTKAPATNDRFKLDVDVLPFKPHIYLRAEFYGAVKEGVAVIFSTSLMFGVL
jgi:hypothetical protein